LTSAAAAAAAAAAASVIRVLMMKLHVTATNNAAVHAANSKMVLFLESTLTILRLCHETSLRHTRVT
jgi:uncharacterized membrane protein